MTISRGLSISIIKLLNFWNIRVSRLLIRMQKFGLICVINFVPVFFLIKISKVFNQSNLRNTSNKISSLRVSTICWFIAEILCPDRTGGKNNWQTCSKIDACIGRCLRILISTSRHLYYFQLKFRSEKLWSFDVFKKVQTCK